MSGLTFDPPKPGHDHSIAYLDGKFVGFRGLKEGDKVCLQRCPKCDVANYALAVTSGVCAFCGFNINA